MSEELYYDTPRGAKMSEHWSKDGLHCIHCGANSNFTHILSCPNYGLYDDEGNPRPVFPKVTANIKVTREDLGMVNPEASPILRYFNYLHLPEHLQDISKMFCVLAEDLENLLPPGPEKSVALRKLLEAKDAAVRSRL